MSLKIKFDLAALISDDQPSKSKIRVQYPSKQEFQNMLDTIEEEHLSVAPRAYSIKQAEKLLEAAAEESGISDLDFFQDDEDQWNAYAHGGLTCRLSLLSKKLKGPMGIITQHVRYDRITEIEGIVNKDGDPCFQADIGRMREQDLPVSWISFGPYHNTGAVQSWIRKLDISWNWPGPNPPKCRVWAANAPGSPSFNPSHFPCDTDGVWSKHENGKSQILLESVFLPFDCVYMCLEFPQLSDEQANILMTQTSIVTRYEMAHVHRVVLEKLAIDNVILPILENVRTDGSLLFIRKPIPKIATDTPIDVDTMIHSVYDDAHTTVIDGRSDTSAFLFQILKYLGAHPVQEDKVLFQNAQEFRDQFSKQWEFLCQSIDSKNRYGYDMGQKQIEILMIVIFAICFEDEKIESLTPGEFQEAIRNGTKLKPEQLEAFSKAHNLEARVETVRELARQRVPLVQWLFD